MLITATTGKTVWVDLTEGGRIRLAGDIVPCAVREIIIRVKIINRVRVPLPIEIITIKGLWILHLTVGVWILLTGDQIFPGTIRLANVGLRVNIIAAGNASVEPDYHPQVRQVVHSG